MKAQLLSVIQQPAGLLIKQTKQLLSVLLAAGMVALATGCASDDPPRTAGQSIDDQAISRRVQEALGADPAYKFPEVKVTTYQSKVQLSGFVDRDEQKGQAEDIAKKVPGVKEVKNDITKK
jgi:hyperosmotically inducible protein